LAIDANQSKIEGKFNLVYRSAPLVDLEPLAAEKSLIAECISRSVGTEKMFDFIHQIYSDYKQFESDNDWVVNIAKWYLDNTSTLKECMDDPTMRDKIQKNIELLFQERINYTPYIGVYYDGKLVWRYAAWYGGAIRVINYLSRFNENADQFWSDELFQKIQKWGLWTQGDTK
jgi:protein-disulfide isomerase